MNLVQKIGQMLVFGWAGESPEESRAINDHARALIDEFHVGGLIIMGRNVEGSTQEEFHGLIDEMQAIAMASDMPPLLVSTDQEGGRVARFRPPHFRSHPAAAEIGRLGNANEARQIGRAIGRELSQVGVNWDFAPVLDVNCNPANPVINDRSFGSNPTLVSQMGAAMMHGLQDDAGVMACGKHFPGHGDTDTDSHFALPVIRHSRDRLNDVELVPFRAAIDEGLASVMSSHILFPEIDPNLPATLSPRILNGLLRHDLAFNGIIVTDCLEMKGVASGWGTPEAAVLAAIAGADMLLVCHTYETQRRVADALVDAVINGRLSEDRVDEANQRIAAAKTRWVVAG